jgi:type III pantothenate kinase
VEKPEGLTGWAAVGPVPAWLPLERRVLSTEVPLGDLPAWLGVDRALGGWWAWRKSGGAVLVADAGTALSLTRVGAEGCFAGGQLMAGAALQLLALGAGTAGLPSLELPVALPEQRWPSATAQAIAAGVLRGLAAAVAQAAREAVRESPHCRLWITGGDGELLLPLVRELLVESSLEVQLAPSLALEALAALRPGLDR